MKKWIIITLLFPAIYSTAQLGFNKTYAFEQEQITGSAFENVLLDNDTLVLFGTCYPPVTPSGQQALLFVKMDTLGNVLMHKCHLDPDAPLDEYAAAPNYGIIKTSDGGYALVGSNIGSVNGLLIKLSYDGDIEFYNKFDSETERQIRKILQLKDGYFLSGLNQLQNYDIQVFLMKVDKQGNFLWEKTYGQPGITEAPASLIKIDDNHFAIGAGKAKIAPSPPYNSGNTWTKAWLLEVDSLGNVINSTESQYNVQTGLGGLKKMPDGWLYTSAKFEINNNQFEWGTRGTIVRTGEDINDLHWERIVGTTSTYVNGMVDIKPSPDGNWVAVGQWATPHPPPPMFGPNYVGGSTFKFTSDGDSLWARLDTAFWHPDCGSENYLGGVAVLPSGSIIAAGYANSNCFPPTPRSYGWILKISTDGCIDTLCSMANSQNPQPVKEIKIFPNPTTGLMNIENSNHYEAEVYDLFGRQVYRAAGLNSQIDITFLPDGVYILKIFDKENKLEIVNKIMKYR